MIGGINAQLVVTSCIFAFVQRRADTRKMTAPRTLLVFDLDGTLYSYSKTQIHEQMRLRIATYVAKLKDITVEAAREVSSQLYKRYGLTGRALAIENNIDAVEYFAYVHALDLSPLKPDTQLHADLAAFTAAGHELWILTNAITSHANACLAALGVLHFFPPERVLDCIDQWKFSAANRESKPLPGAYDLLLERSGAVAGRDTIVMLEDSEENLHEPARRGWGCVFVIDKCSAEEVAEARAKHSRYHCISDISQLRSAIAAVTSMPISPS